MYVPSDWSLTEDNPTFGSGTNTSQGGGRILISSATKLNVTGEVRADGGDNSRESSHGAGSGGSIVAVGASVVGSGTMSVRGGDTVGSGGAGGGGRISIQVLDLNSVQCVSLENCVLFVVIIVDCIISVHIKI
jgi:hypothetical protein